MIEASHYETNFIWNHIHFLIRIPSHEQYVRFIIVDLSKRPAPVGDLRQPCLAIDRRWHAMGKPRSMLKPPRYFPIERGLYEVAPGLKPLGFSYGNGELDEKIFQIDTGFENFRKNKIECRKERLAKYIQAKDLHAETESTIANFLIRRLQKEYPELFSSEESDKEIFFKARHTKDQMIFSKVGALLQYETQADISPAPVNALDALLLQVPEDVAITQRSLEEKKRLARLLESHKP